MFEAGQKYRITTGLGDDKANAVYRVVRVQMPLIEIEAAGRKVILNTSCPDFVSAMQIKVV